MKKISYYRKKADKLMQKWGMLRYKECLICGGKLSCLHHYYPKSISLALRYDKDNLIPICKSCHFAHHCKNEPEIHIEICKIKGKEWINRLGQKKNKIIKVNKKYY